MQKFKIHKKLILLSLIFIIPYLAALFLYRLHPHLPTMQSGELLKEPFPLSNLVELKLQGRHWHFVYVADKICGKVCQEDLSTLRQVRIALNVDASRVHRLLLSTVPATLDQIQQPDLVSKVVDNVEMQKFLQARQAGLYLIDPKGKAILFYGNHLKAKSIYQDSQRLLKYG